MKKLIVLLLALQTTAAWSQSNQKILSAYFERPISCPLRFSSLSQLRDQVQTLTASLGSSCSQSGQQALNQLNSSVANLEGIANTWSTFQGSDTQAQNVQLAKNASQVLGSLNIITSNNACFYDIRSRGALPVVSDIVMSLSQLGLLIPSTTGVLVATGGYIAGSGLKIINELVKKKFNWNRPEERRAFLQLNCAFFDNRRIMEEMGLFNPETKSFRQQLLLDFKREKLQLVKLQKQNEVAVKKLEGQLDLELTSIPAVKSQGLNPLLKRKLDELSHHLAGRPADYAAKWKQVSQLALFAPHILEMLSVLTLEGIEQEAVRLMSANLEKVLPELAQDGKAWTNTIDEYELAIRGPVVAFAGPISQALAKTLSVLEAEASGEDKELARRLSEVKVSLKEAQAMVWGASQRIVSIDAKIASLEASEQNHLFSQSDEGKSDAVELLDYYRKLQKSILGKEGKGYLKHSLARMDDVRESLNQQLLWFEDANGLKERCAAAEKLRFAWAQYRYKVQESYDFVATNLDLYRSSFKIGRERQKRSTSYVINQFSSIDEEDVAGENTIGFYMNDVRSLMEKVEGKLQASGCF